MFNEDFKDYFKEETNMLGFRLIATDEEDLVGFCYVDDDKKMHFTLFNDYSLVAINENDFLICGSNEIIGCLYSEDSHIHLFNHAFFIPLSDEEAQSEWIDDDPQGDFN